MECKTYSAPGCRTFPTGPVSFTQTALRDVLSLYSYELYGQTARHANGSRKKLFLCLYMAKRGLLSGRKGAKLAPFKGRCQKMDKSAVCLASFSPLSAVSTRAGWRLPPYRSASILRMTGFTEELSRESRRRSVLRGGALYGSWGGNRRSLSPYRQSEGFLRPFLSALFCVPLRLQPSGYRLPSFYTC